MARSAARRGERGIRRWLEGGARTGDRHEDPARQDRGASDQGSQFTSTDFIKVPAAREIRISMDGKGDWRDNVLVERLWRIIKYEEVYLRAYASVSEARAGIGSYVGFYNGRRPDSSLDGKTPDQACFNPSAPEVAAA